MPTTLRDLVQHGKTQTLPDLWAAPRPDGALARALRLAQAQKSTFEAGDGIANPAIPLEDLPPDLLPVFPPPPLAASFLAEDIEALAREARAGDGAREARALALVWPEETAEGDRAGRARAWMGWLALGGAIVLAAAAAAAAIVFAPAEPAFPAVNRGLRMDKQLSLPPSVRDARSLPNPRTGG